MNLKDKKILVTGSAGFLGKSLIRKLLERGVPEKNIFAPGSAKLDLRKRENCEKAVEGIEVVIHLAGITSGVDFHQKMPAEIFYDNLLMGVELMEAARKAGVRKFVSIGSATEYPDKTPAPFKEENIWDGIPEPTHLPYAIAKKMLLVQAQAYRKQYGFNAIHLLLTSMYGPGEREAGGPIPSIIKRAAEAKKAGASYIEVWGTGKPTRDFLYVEDAAEGILLAAERYDKPEPVNLGSGRGVSIKETAEIILKLTDLRAELRFDASKPDGQMCRILNVERAEKEFGFRASTAFEEGIKETIKYHLG